MDDLQTRIAEQVRANTAFEQMIVSVLLGASLCGVAFFLLSIVAAIFGGYAWLDFIAGEFANALLYAFVIFIAGFLAAGLLVTPLFVALEKIPYRRTWPFILAAILFQFALYALFFRDFSGAQARTVFFILPMFAPGIVISLIFGRRMQPFWRAAARAEAAPPGNLPQLH